MIKDRLIVGCKNTVIPQTVTAIGNNAFYGCKELSSITIAACITSIGDEAFSYCDGLESIIIEPNNLIYDSRNNCNSIIETATNTLIAGCMNSIIPDGITTIGDYAFEGCSSLTTITIPESVTSIGYYSFFGCTGLSAIIIPKSVTYTAYYAFGNCSNLKFITLNSIRVNEQILEYKENYDIILQVPSDLIYEFLNNYTWRRFKKIVPIGTPTKLDITIPEYGYTTFYYTQDYDLPKGVQAIVVSDITNGKLQYDVIANGDNGGTIPAGVAVMLKSNEPGEKTYTLNLSLESLSYDGTNLLMGAEQDTITFADENSLFYKLTYGLDNVAGWYWGALEGGAFQIDAHYAWLAIPVLKAGGSIGFTLTGEPSNSVESTIYDAGKDVMYDLYGRKLDKPVKNGLMIINGKKVYTREL